MTNAACVPITPRPTSPPSSTWHKTSYDETPARTPKTPPPNLFISLIFIAIFFSRHGSLPISHLNNTSFPGILRDRIGLSAPVRRLKFVWCRRCRQKRPTCQRRSKCRLLERCKNRPFEIAGRLSSGSAAAADERGSRDFRVAPCLTRRENPRAGRCRPTVSILTPVICSQTMICLFGYPSITRPSDRSRRDDVP